MGDPNASLPTPQPIYYRPMFGSFGHLLADTCVTFVSQAADAARRGRAARPAAAGRSREEHAQDRQARHGAQRAARRRSKCRPETFAVTVDGVHATVPPLKTISLNQKYFFS